MAVSRSGATASVITVGGKQRVLIAGGENAQNATSILEIFDPETNQFSLASSAMAAARKGHAAAVLQDGRVLIAGGSNGETVIDTVEIFDPATGLPTVAGKMAQARAGLTATTLMNGRVLLAGGNNGSSDLGTAEIFDPATGSFTVVPMASARSEHQAFILPNNYSVLLVGGTSGGNAVSSVERFVPWFHDGAQAFLPLASMQSARSRFAGGALKENGVLMISGGVTENGSAANSTEGIAFGTLVTDKQRYLPGETVSIHGSGWRPGETVKVAIGESPITAEVDWRGEVDIQATAPEPKHLGTVILVTASGSSDAAALFSVNAMAGSDGIVRSAASGKQDGILVDLRAATGGPNLGDYSQCSNNDNNLGHGYTSGNQGCRWINGNLNPNNSAYQEGDATVQRALLTDVPEAGTQACLDGTGATNCHSITFQYNITKNGAHAYDYLASDNYSELNPPDASWVGPAYAADICDGYTGGECPVRVLRSGHGEQPRDPLCGNWARNPWRCYSPGQSGRRRAAPDENPERRHSVNRCAGSPVGQLCQHGRSRARCPVPADQHTCEQWGRELRESRHFRWR